MKTEVVESFENGSFKNYNESLVKIMQLSVRVRTRKNVVDYSWKWTKLNTRKNLNATKALQRLNPKRTLELFCRRVSRSILRDGNAEVQSLANLEKMLEIRQNCLIG